MTKHELEQALQHVLEENQRLHQRIAHLERELAKARTTSKTSSKPPSSDIVKPPKSVQKNKWYTLRAFIGANDVIPLSMKGGSFKIDGRKIFI
jgi:cell division septum initiation protein DivIVA